MFASKQPNSLATFIILTRDDVNMLLTFGELLSLGIQDTLRGRKVLTPAQEEVIEGWLNVFYWGIIAYYDGPRTWVLPVLPTMLSRTIRRLHDAGQVRYVNHPKGRFVLGIAQDVANLLQVDGAFKFGPVAKLVAAKNEELFLQRGLDSKKLLRFVNRVQAYFVEVTMLDPKVEWFSSKVGAEWWEGSIGPMVKWPTFSVFFSETKTGIKTILQTLRTNILQLLTAERPKVGKYLDKKLRIIYG